MQGLNTLSYNERKQRIKDELEKYKRIVENELSSDKKQGGRSMQVKQDGSLNSSRISSPGKNDAYANELMKQIYEHKERKLKLKEEEDYYNSKYYPGWGTTDASASMQHTDFHPSSHSYDDRNKNHSRQNRFASMIDGSGNGAHGSELPLNHYDREEGNHERLDSHHHSSKRNSHSPNKNKSKKSSTVNGHRAHGNEQELVDGNDYYKHDEIQELQSTSTKFVPKEEIYATDDEIIPRDPRKRILKYIHENQRMMRSIQTEIEILHDKLRICEKQQKLLLEELHQDDEESTFNNLNQLAISDKPANQPFTDIFSYFKALDSVQQQQQRQEQIFNGHHENDDGQSQRKGSLSGRPVQMNSENAEQDLMSQLNSQRINRVVHFDQGDTPLNQHEERDELGSLGEHDPLGRQGNEAIDYSDEDISGEYEDEEEMVHSVVDENDVEPLPVEAQYFIYVAEKPHNLSASQSLQRPLGKSSVETSKTTSGDQNTSAEYENGHHDDEDEEVEEEEENEEESSNDGDTNNPVNEKGYAALLALKRAAALNLSSEDEDDDDLIDGNNSKSDEGSVKKSPRLQNPLESKSGSKGSSKSPQRTMMMTSKEEIIRAKNELLASANDSVPSVGSQNTDRGSGSDASKGISLKKSPSLISSGSFLLLDSDPKDIGDIFAKGGTFDI